MKSYFNSKVIAQWTKDAKNKFPEESCGLFVDREGVLVYVPMENISETPDKTFEIDPTVYYQMEEEEDIKALVHSHIEHPHASKKDMEKQQEMGIPWGVLNFHKGAPREHFFFGEELPMQDFIGRPFYHGVYDCYGLVRDFYRHCNLPMIDHPREWDWWKKDGPNLLMTHYKDNGFHPVSQNELQEGDVILMSILANQANHCALYLGGNLMLHHLVNRLSRREPYLPWSKSSIFFVRHEDAEKNPTIRKTAREIYEGTFS